MVYSTDKSEKIVLDTKENFLLCIKDHYSKDKVVSPEEVRKTELHMNNYSRSWAKVFGIGTGSGGGQSPPCNCVLISNYNTIPTLQGLRKDHKGNIDEDPVKGPKLRPLCVANKAPNTALGNIVARMAKSIGDSIAESIGGEVNMSWPQTSG